MQLVIDDVTVIEESLNTFTAWDVINNNRHLKPKVGCKGSPDCFKTFEEIVNVMPLVTQANKLIILVFCFCLLAFLTI